MIAVGLDEEVEAEADRIAKREGWDWKLHTYDEWMQLKLAVLAGLVK